MPANTRDPGVGMFNKLVIKSVNTSPRSASPKIELSSSLFSRKSSPVISRISAPSSMSRRVSKSLSVKVSTMSLSLSSLSSIVSL